jgi:hypothetical protein
MGSGYGNGNKSREKSNFLFISDEQEKKGPAGGAG